MNKPIHYVTKKFKQFRDDRDWSQKEMADFLTLQLGKEISRTTVNYWENAKRGLMAEQALELSKALSIPPIELFEQRNG